MKILVCGDRNWMDGRAIRRELEQFSPTETTIIHGGAAGADSMAGFIAKSLGMQVEVYPADWKKYSKGAGPVRNQQMLDEGKPDLVLAFHPDITISKGTGDMVRRSKLADLEIRLFDK